MQAALRVGIIGASANGGWAKVSHVPAVQNLKGLELTAVAGSSQASADKAAKAFGAKTAYGNAADLVRGPEVDIVAICVKVPEHRDLVLGALAAGKHIYCEWPLGRNLEEAEEMAAAARIAGVHAVIGLQTRMNPVALRARDLVNSGKIGRLLSARVYSSTAAFGEEVPPSMIYTEDPDNGANLLSIQGAHTLDFAMAQLSAFASMNALTTIQYPDTKVGEDAKPGRRSLPDHVLVQARLAQGAALSLEVAGGRPPEEPFRLEAVGTEGVLTLEGGSARGFQAGRLRLFLNGEPQRVDEGETASMPDESANVAAVYAALREDILHGTSTSTDFDHAVRLTRLVDDVALSGRNGTRAIASDWPRQ